ncbi:molybdopterin-dependent oxidoreductase, partial [Saccharothrix sp. ST-888]|uniref:molybdopterin-dependent oxidoreductase n=1 Tax=Saccharothrix sp. ST-888 TaxID=1427391 RepID=UPI003FA710AC
MQGRRVAQEHGGPVRLYVARMNFYKCAKWLVSITLTSTVQPGYWQHFAYGVDAWVGRCNGRDDGPTAGARPAPAVHPGRAVGELGELRADAGLPGHRRLPVLPAARRTGRPPQAGGDGARVV